MVWGPQADWFVVAGQLPFRCQKWDKWEEAGSGSTKEEWAQFSPGNSGIEERLSRAGMARRNLCPRLPVSWEWWWLWQGSVLRSLPDIDQLQVDRVENSQCLLTVWFHWRGFHVASEDFFFFKETWGHAKWPVIPVFITADLESASKIGNLGCRSWELSCSGSSLGLSSSTSRSASCSSSSCSARSASCSPSDVGCSSAGGGWGGARIGGWEGGLRGWLPLIGVDDVSSKLLEFFPLRHLCLLIANFMLLFCGSLRESSPQSGQVPVD